jgi:hypothetical protein
MSIVIFPYLKPRKTKSRSLLSSFVKNKIFSMHTSLTRFASLRLSTDPYVDLYQVSSLFGQKNRIIWLANHIRHSFFFAQTSEMFLKTKEQLFYQLYYPTAYSLIINNFLKKRFSFSFYKLYLLKFSLIHKKKRILNASRTSLPIRSLGNKTISKILRRHRVFLVTSSQNRVKLPLQLWNSSNLWRRISLQTNTSFSLFTYRHVAQSEYAPAAMLVNSPHIILMTLILSNPYFWGVIRNVLHSKYFV